MSKAFYIGPYESGLINAIKPFSLPEDSFATLENAYVWRGVVKKRIGSRLFTTSGVAPAFEQLYSRLRIAIPGGKLIGITDGTGNAAGFVPGIIWEIGQMFSIGNVMYTVISLGVAQAMLQTDATTTATYDTTNGAFLFAGAPINTQIYFYPASPVMGITTYEAAAINDEPCYAFDRQFAYQRAGGGWDRLGLGLWSGLDSQFFWATNYRGVTNDNYYLFAVNYNRADSIKYLAASAWTTIVPQTRQNATGGGAAANYTVQSARICVSFKDRLIFLNTLETVDVGAGAVPVTFTNRARWCLNGNPIGAAAPACLGAWYDDVPGVGGWLEAPTKEAIITAKILKDRLIVYFERSTWELVYTGNQVLPFVWQTIDDQLGAESTFSSVLFDKVVFGVGQSGVHQCDGMRVSRIDDKIPYEVFKIHNGNSGVERVAGIRDYSTEMVYWTFPAAEDNPVFPNRMLVYNYKNGSWSFNDDSITAFGYIQNTDDLTWGACSYTWEEFGRLWSSGLNQSLTRTVLAGNQEGYTFILDAEKHSNAPALQITDIDLAVLPLINITVINHNLQQGDFIKLEFVQGTTNLNNYIFKVISASSAFPNTFTIEQQPGLVPVGAYTGGGVISRVSKIDIQTKAFNFYQDGMRMAIDKVDFDVDKSSAGQLYVNFFSSTSRTFMADESIINQVNMGNYMLDTTAYPIFPQEANQKRVTRPVYIQAEGDCIQLQLTWLDEQMYDIGNMESAFELNSMTFYAAPTGRRL